MTKQFYLENKEIIDDIRSRPHEFTMAILFPKHYRPSEFRRKLAGKAWEATLLYVMADTINVNMTYRDVARETGTTLDTARRYVLGGLRRAKTLAKRGWVDPKPDRPIMSTTMH